MYRWCPTCWPTWTISLCSVWGRGGCLTCAVYRCCPNCWFIWRKNTPLFSLGQRWVSDLYCIQVFVLCTGVVLPGGPPGLNALVHLGADVGILPVLCTGVVLPDSIALFSWGVGVEIDSLCSVGVRGRYLTCTLCRCCPTCWSTFSRRSLCSAGTRGRYLALFLSPAWLSYRCP